ncbi:aminoglycoside phosphotransferase family protein [Cellulosimicrobium funkei]|uniref:aminoglycoside phosphotransferase family protein n=1 Tax=Cellulosimicrobium TaxID=157920 RepID=UPI00148E953C|nr:aminoglycoside phosphotransferase family protein [Cellulosimicrobium sp. 72-3]
MDDTTTEQELTGGNVNDVVRRGDTVRRSAGPWTPTVQALLAWVRAQGASFVPAPLGLDEQGREVLGWIPGETGGWPIPDWVWTAAAREQAAGMLRTVHDASVGFAPPGAVWRSPVREPAEIVCLNDVAPYNMVHDGERVVGFIDVDMAAPGPRAWDLAYLAYRMCGWCEDMPAPADARPEERLAHLLEAYGPDAAPGSAVVLRTMRERLLDLADWTEERARTTGRDDLREHAALYRRDVERLPRG